MKNSFCLGGLAVALLGLVAGVVHGQAPTMMSNPARVGAPSNAGGVGMNWGGGAVGGNQAAAANSLPPPTGGFPDLPGPDTGTPSRLGPPGAGSTPGSNPVLLPSEWLQYPRACNCCGPKGGDGPIGSEIYSRIGASLPFGGFLANTMKPGWVIAGGLRTLLFNPEQDAAWTVDLGISNANYNSTTRKSVDLRTVVLGTTLNNPIIPAGLNHTFVNLAVGKEYYLWGSARDCCNGPIWRVGGDVGGRWGSSKLDVFNGRHRTDVVGGLFFSVHSDVEVPCGCCILLFGARAEYGYTWSDILQSHNNADVQAINLMVTTGIRF